MSYSHEDASAAALIARSLQLNFAVELSNPEFALGQTISSAIYDAIESSDVVIVLLSQAALRTDWVRAETAMALSQESKRRDIDLVPVLLEPCEIPDGLRDRLAVDLSQDGALGVGRLITRLMGDRAVDFKALDASSFESLVAEILRREDFALTAVSRNADMGRDFTASHGGERWVIEVKQYTPQKRLSVSVINQVIEQVRRYEPEANALLVTSGQLTSVAQDYLDHASRQMGGRIRVIDGVELKQLLAKHPDLIDRYFAPGRPGARQP
jgi:Predicted endonuclease distantly related to archaeal Holliday junction resolvase and Mrr-like restriction enzymes